MIGMLRTVVLDAPDARRLAVVLTVPIRAWRLVSRWLPPRCRFYPSCSAYALEALSTHGAFRGTWLATRRLLRCHPWNPGGIDPVPPRRPRPARRPHPGPDRAPDRTRPGADASPGISTPGD